MNRTVLCSLTLVAGAICPVRADVATQGRDSWAGKSPHVAVVNPVSREILPPDGSVISLRGDWDFAYRGFLNGRCSIGAYLPTGRGWEQLGTNAVRKMHVPGTWESQGLGESGMSRGWVCRWDCGMKPIRHAFQGEGWYRREVEIPERWRDRRIWLKTGLISGYGYLWINGKQVAHVDLYCGTVKYDVTEFVKPGEKAMVVVQAINTGTSRSGGLCSLNYWGGILRDIELESTPDVFIDDAWVRGDFDGRRAEVKVEIGGELGKRDGRGNGSISLRATIEGATVQLPLSTSTSSLHLEIPLRNFRPWSPEHPNLYWAKIELLQDGQVVQTRMERFGVRKLEVVGREFRLNGRPFFVRGCGWHNLYPIEGTAPADRETFRRLARKIRSCGFNACRFHTSCRPPELFEAADEVGLLLQPELPYYGDTPASGQAFDPLGDAKELYLNFRRHPSFAFYSGGNEGWFGPVLSKRLYEEIKARDPDRLMISQDGWNNEETNQRGFADYQGGPMNVWPRGSVRPDMPFVAHEYLNLTIKLDSRTESKYTGVVLPPATRLGREQWLKRFGLDLESGDRLQDAQSFLQKTWFKYGIESARLDPECDGYSYWSLQDAGGKNGDSYSGQALFDPFMDEKPAGMRISDVARFNSESCLLLDTDPRLCDPSEEKVRFKRNPFEMHLTDFATNRVRCAGERIDAHCYLAHYGERDFGPAILRWKLVSDGRSLAEGETNVCAQSVGAVREIARLSVAVPDLESASRATLRVEFEDSEGKVCNDWDWWLFPRRHRIGGGKVFVAEPFRPALSARFLQVVQTPDEADVVIGPTNDPVVVSAVGRGKHVVTLAGCEGESNVRLGWWWMGKQMGAVLANHPALKYLPHEGVLSPLLFRIMKDGASLTPATHRDSLVVYGEGGDACYRYLIEKRHASGSVEMAVSGMNLLADLPESDAIFEGIVRYLGGQVKGRR